MKARHLLDDTTDAIADHGLPPVLQRCFGLLVGSVAGLVGLPAAFLAVVGCIATGVLALELVKTSAYWYSPGDPARADWALSAGGLALLGLATLTALRWAACRYTAVLWARKRAARQILSWLGVAIVVALVLPLSILASRFGPVWRPIRSAAWNQIQTTTLTPGTGAQPSKSHLVALSGWPHRVDVSVLEGGSWPKIRVDFGDGCVAHFDLRTMYCTYSD